MSADNEKIAALAADVKKLWTPDSRDAGAHCAPASGSALWCDLRSDAERADFLRSGRAYATGIIAASIADDVADAYDARRDAHILRAALADFLGDEAVYGDGDAETYPTAEQVASRFRAWASEPNK